MSKREFKTIRKAHGVPKGARVLETKMGLMVLRADSEYCAYLSSEGSCGVYAVRPSVCQKYGEVPELPCQYLFPRKVQAMVDSYLKGCSG